MATTEKDITEMSLRLAGAGHQVGLNQAQIMGFSAALSSVGIEAEAGGSAFSKVFMDMSSSVQTGNAKLQQFAKVAGMSGQQFQIAFKKDAAGAMVSFIKGLSEAKKHGTSAIKVLDDMGISEIRTRDALLRAAGAGDLFNKSLNISTNAWKQNTALNKEASQRYATTESKLKMLKNQIVDSAMIIGNNLLPTIRDIIQKVANLTQSFSKLSPATQKNIIGLGLFGIAMGPILATIGKLNTGVSIVLGSISKFSKVLSTGGTIFKAVLAAIGGPATLVTAIILGIVAAGIALYMNWDKIKATAQFLGKSITKVWTDIKQNTIKLWQGVCTFLTTLWNNIKIICFNTWNSIKQHIANFMNNVSNNISNGWNNICSFFSTLWENIKQIFMSALDNIVSFVTSKFSFLFAGIQTIFNAIKEYYTGIWEVIKNIFLGAILIVLDIVTGNFTKLKTDTQQIWNNIKDGFSHIWSAIKTIFTTALNLVVQIVTKTWSLITTTTSSAWNSLKSFLASLWNNLVSTCINAWNSMKQNTITLCNNIKQGAIDIWNNLINWFLTLPSRLYNAAVQMFTSMKNGVVATGESVKQGARDIGNKIVTAFTELPGKMIEIGQNIVQGLVNGIENFAGHVWDVAKNLASGVANKIRGALDIHSPSRVMIEIGKFIDEGLAKGIEDNSNIPEQSSKKIANMIANEISKIKDYTKEEVSKLNTELSKIQYEESINLRGKKGKEYYAIKDIYTFKKNKIKEQLKLIKSETDTEIEQLITLSKYNKEQLKQELQRRKDFVNKVNDLSKQIVDSLKEQYSSEEKLQEDDIKKQSEKLETWKSESIERINNVYSFKIKCIEESSNIEIEAIQKKIDALNNLEKQTDRNNQDNSDLSKINDLKQSLKFEHNSFNKDQLEKELKKAIYDRNKRLEKQALDDKKDNLQKQINLIKSNTDKQKAILENQKRNEINNINIIAKTEESNYQKRLNNLKDFYTTKLKQENLQAQAEEMIMNNKQKEIISLFNSYGSTYKATGQSLGQKLLDGFAPKIQELKNMISSINKSISDARESSLLRSYNNISTTTNINNANKHNTFNVTVQGNSNNNNDIENTIRSLAFSV